MLIGGGDPNPPHSQYALSPSLPPTVRHAEKRRTGTCRFADRVAALSVRRYREVVRERFRTGQKHACLATIVAAFGATGSVGRDDADGDLVVLGLGVGTKFLPESVVSDPALAASSDYGDRVRDCHAEVLARRAFRRHLSLEMLRNAQEPRHHSCRHRQAPTTGSETTSGGHQPLLPLPRILERVEPMGEGGGEPSENATTAPAQPRVRYRLRDGVTLHFYCSSAPCGNAVLKKFATLRRETFRADVPDGAWPDESHDAMPGHSQPLGQFALLCKRDRNAAQNQLRGNPSTGMLPLPTPGLTGKQARWPCYQSDAWCPPGTTTVQSGAGSLHTCSDKLGRWNCLGLQGSLLISRLDKPLYMSTLTVGRKLSAVICKRAVCCRFGPDSPASTDAPRADAIGMGAVHPAYRLHHPAVLGTGVYLDEDGVIVMKQQSALGDSKPLVVEGQDVRFHSSESWVWWPGLGGTAECIDGATGYLRRDDDNPDGDAGEPAESSPIDRRSLVSTSSLVELYQELLEEERCSGSASNDSANTNAVSATKAPGTLQELRRFKVAVSEDYERVKEALLRGHPLLKHWKRRSHACHQQQPPP